jgi:hypothetical protein
MKKSLIMIGLFVMIVGLAVLYSGEFTYVGAGKCKLCHKTEKQGEQFPKWEARMHSKSYQALTTDKAKELCPDPLNNKECLSCHAPLTGKADEEIVKEGVTCEVCHGAGSDYKKLTVMKDHAKAVEAGLTDYPNEEAIKKQCLTCHEKAHDKTFDFAAYWEKVKHAKPSE